WTPRRWRNAPIRRECGAKARHCERSEAIHRAPQRKNGLLRCARNDGKRSYADARLSWACAGFARILDFAVALLPLCPFNAWPFNPAPFALPFSCGLTFALAFAFALRAFVALAFCF